MPRLHSSATPSIPWTRWAIRGLILVIACIIEPLILVYGSSTARGILAVLLPIAALIWMASTLLEYQRLRVQWQHEANGRLLAYAIGRAKSHELHELPFPVDRR